MSVISIVVGAGLHVCSSNSGGGLTFSTARIGEGTGSTFIGSNLEANKQDIAAEIEYIRNAGGLTRDQLASLLGVSRRTIHTWANGGPIRNDHHDRVMSLADQTRKMKAQPPFKVRQALFKKYGLAPKETVPAPAGTPVLASDEQPFVHQLDIRPAKLKILRK